MTTAFERAYKQTIAMRQVAKKIAEEAVLMSNFKREDRYLVLKRCDIEMYLNKDDSMRLARISRDITNARMDKGRPPLKCVCIESDWPEYETAWSMIENRVFKENVVSELDKTEHKCEELALSDMTECQICEKTKCVDCFTMDQDSEICDQCATDLRLTN